MSEQVFVVPRDKLFAGQPVPHGFGKNDLTGLLERIVQHGKFADRATVETDPSLKQIIPYMLVSWQDKIFTLHRQKGQTEKRLHHKYSIGVGGHINPVELTKSSDDKKNIIEKGLERELHEELSVNCPYQYELAGFLNDDSNPVGEVHFGLVFKVSVEDGPAVTVAEKDLMKGEFMTADEIKKFYPDLETWSQIVFDNLVKKQTGSTG